MNPLLFGTASNGSFGRCLSFAEFNNSLPANETMTSARLDFQLFWLCALGARRHKHSVILPARIIDNDHHLAPTHCRNGILDTGKFLGIPVSCRHDLKLFDHMQRESADSCEEIWANVP